MSKQNACKATSILFVGNSFTQRNDLPNLIAELAAACDHYVSHQLVSAGGASLRRHWNAGEAVSRIQAGSFDYVVLQEQSTLPVKNAGRMAESVRLFDAVIKRAGARAVLYMTWARENAPETQQAISDAYEKIGEELGALVVPVGNVWQQVFQNRDQPLLYDRDGSHPSLAGSYLAACVFAITLFQLDIANLKTGPAGLSLKDRLELQCAVSRFCRPASRHRKP